MSTNPGKHRLDKFATKPQGEKQKRKWFVGKIKALLAKTYLRFFKAQSPEYYWWFPCSTRTLQMHSVHYVPEDNWAHSESYTFNAFNKDDYWSSLTYTKKFISLDVPEAAVMGTPREAVTLRDGLLYMLIIYFGRGKKRRQHSRWRFHIARLLTRTVASSWRYYAGGNMFATHTTKGDKTQVINRRLSLSFLPMFVYLHRSLIMILLYGFFLLLS